MQTRHTIKKEASKTMRASETDNVCVRVRQHALKQKAVSARFAASAAAKGNLQRKLFKYFGFCSNLKKATEGEEDPEEKGKKSGVGKKGEGGGVEQVKLCVVCDDERQQSGRALFKCSELLHNPRTGGGSAAATHILHMLWQREGEEERGTETCR